MSCPSLLPCLGAIVSLLLSLVLLCVFCERRRRKEEESMRMGRRRKGEGGRMDWMDQDWRRGREGGGREEEDGSSPCLCVLCAPLPISSSLPVSTLFPVSLSLSFCPSLNSSYSIILLLAHCCCAARRNGGVAVSSTPCLPCISTRTACHHQRACLYACSYLYPNHLFSTSRSLAAHTA